MLPTFWVPSPKDGLRWALDRLMDGLGLLPPGLGWIAYCASMLWLTRVILRRVRPMPINDRHPAFHPPAWVGVHPWIVLSWLRLGTILIPAMFFGMLPQILAETAWRRVYSSGYGTVELGLLGRLSELVGSGCGLVIGIVCQGQLMGLLVVGGLAYAAWRLLQAVLGG